MKALTSLTLGLLGSVLVCASPHKSAPKPAQDGNEASPVDGPSTEDRFNAALQFKRHCVHCHGPNAEGGRGPALAVARLARAGNEEALIKIITEGIAGTEMPRFFFDKDQAAELARWVLQLGQRPVPPVNGSPELGRELYFTRGNCASCHAIRGEGAVSGPDLGEVGLRRGVDYIKRALVEPEADLPENFVRYRWHTVIPDNYLQVRLVTRAPAEFAGVRLNEDPFTIQIREASGKIRSVLKSELAALHKEWGRSVMPSYREVFSAAELDDLVAFLSSLRGVQ